MKKGRWLIHEINIT